MVLIAFRAFLDQRFYKIVAEIIYRADHLEMYSMILFYNFQYKCDSILEVIKCAPIPWSKEINSLVQQALKLDHDL